MKIQNTDDVIGYTRSHEGLFKCDTYIYLRNVKYKKSV